MKSKLLTGFLFLQFFCACNNEESITTSENDVDGARNFIQSALEGDYNKARAYIIGDTTNIQYLDAFERNFKNRMSPEDKKGYRTASINIHKVREIDESTTIVIYSNSYMKKNDSLKVSRLNGEWLIDLKYSFAVKDSFP
jgi:type IV secretory pathway component VirB8